MNDSQLSGCGLPNNRYGLPNDETGLANQDKQPTLPVTAKETPPRFLQYHIKLAALQSQIELLEKHLSMFDPMRNRNGGPINETGLANQDKQPTLPVAAKKTALRDLQNEIRIAGPESRENSLSRKESGPISEASKVCGTKRPAPELLVSPPHLPTPTTNAANGPLVYVRRRPEIEVAKTSISDNTRHIAYVPQEERKLGAHDEIMEEKTHMKEPKISGPEIAPIGTRASLMCSSSGKHSVSPLADSNPRPVYPATAPLDYPKKWHSEHLEERYCQLQDSLNGLDQSRQEDYMQMLRSLSSVELSRRAIELEKRSIQLSLEEAKEIQRVRIFDVLGKYPKISRAP